MGQSYNLLERPPSTLFKSSRFDQQMYGHLPFAPSMKPSSRSQQQGRHNGQAKPAKSMSVDASDLRRRLNIVLAEQKQQKKRQLERQASADANIPITAAQDRLSAARLNRQSSARDLYAEKSASVLPNKTPSPLKEHPIPKEDGSPSRQRQEAQTRAVVRSSSKGTLRPPRHSQSIPELGHSYSAFTLKQPLPPSESIPYQHVPQDAAAQFTRTASGKGMQKTQVVHPIARGALERQEQARLVERHSIASDLTNKIWSLKRVRSQNQQNAAYNRNQFQNDSLSGGKHRRNTVHESSFNTITEIGTDNIFEDAEFLAKQKLQDSRCREPENAAEYAQRVNDHRIDWTQTDEAGKKRSSLLLSFRSKKADTKTTAGPQPATATTKGKGRMTMLVEKIDIPKASSPPLASPKSPKSPLSFFSKFKRQQYVKA
ncbi:hypothetical protein MN608_01108 [Microdochium nivale]|nr:hypothetical protein MN608_01108 [Microdochium nivale]